MKYTEDRIPYSRSCVEVTSMADGSLGGYHKVRSVGTHVPAAKLMRFGVWFQKMLTGVTPEPKELLPYPTHRR